MGQFKGINQKYFCEFNEFISFLRGGFYFMHGFVSFNSDVVCPVCKDFCNHSVIKKVVNLFFKGAAFSSKLFKGTFKDASTSTNYNRRAFPFPKALLQVFVEDFKVIRKGLVGVWHRRLRPVFKDLYVRKGGHVLKFFKAFLDLLVMCKGCFNFGKDILLTVRAFAKAMGIDNLVGFVCNGLFFNNLITIEAGNCKACFVIARRASNFNSNHRGGLL